LAKQERRELANRVEAVYCASISQGLSFAVADAYQRWSDVSDEEVAKITKKLKWD
jgi:predicted phosphoribosyltransferase